MYYFQKWLNEERSLWFRNSSTWMLIFPYNQRNSYCQPCRNTQEKVTTQQKKNPGKSRSLRSGGSKMHKLFHSKHELNITSLFKNCNIDRPVEEPASFFGQGLWHTQLVHMRNFWTAVWEKAKVPGVHWLWSTNKLECTDG